MHDTRERGRLQGVRNIVRFNAPIYLEGLVTCVLGLGAWVGAPALVAALGPASLTPHEAERAAALARVLGASAALTALVLTLGTLVASYLTHDRSGLYTWVCLEPYLPTPLSRIAHVHTGLGESSASLRLRFPEAELHVFDASAPAAQPAPSIARARVAWCRCTQARSRAGSARCRCRRARWTCTSYPWPRTRSATPRRGHGRWGLDEPLGPRAAPARDGCGPRRARRAPRGVPALLSLVHRADVAVPHQPGAHAGAHVLRGSGRGIDGYALVARGARSGEYAPRAARLRGARALLGARWCAQHFVYSPSLWRGRRFETAVHVLFTALWTWLTSVYA
jgi:hypothetical protein